MRRSASKSRRRRPTAIVLGLLLVFIVAAVGLVAFGSSGDDTKATAKARSSTSSDTTAVTLATTTTTRRPKVDYAVKAGDTITSISAQFHISSAVILDANEIPNPDNLVVGQVLVIPPPRRVRLVITPAKIPVGDVVTFDFEGAQPDEAIVFVIVSPAGATFTGPPHSSSTSGRVSTSYQTAPDALPGVYVVTARGTLFTTAQATFRVRAAAVP